jgi:hypothetical protein
MNVVNLPVGQYDAVRTLRELLTQAERGDFQNVLVVCDNRDTADESGRIWASWSHMDTRDVWFIVGWLFSYVQRRYFSGKGLIDE